MAKKKKRQIEQYDHKGKDRPNNPPVGMVTPDTDKSTEKQQYAYDPHLDPQLQWAGKTERTSFEVDTVSLHVHERIDPKTIMEAVRRKNGTVVQPSLFENERAEPMREAIDFYKHRHNWSNRLVAGDSLLVMNSLLTKEGMGGKVQMVYIDPPYGIKYGSNFQPFVNKRDVKDRKDEDLTQEPEMIKAFRDTWELGIHSYLSYLRDRLLLARELLTESGSVFVQISDENVHHVREIMDEVFGVENFVSLITFVTTSSQTSQFLPAVCDYIVWYCKDKPKLKYYTLYEGKSIDSGGGSKYTRVRTNVDEYISLNAAREEYGDTIPDEYRIYRIDTLTSQSGGDNSAFTVDFRDKKAVPRKGYWKTNKILSFWETSINIAFFSKAKQIEGRKS